MLAVDIAHEDRLVAVMDIGTNTELIVGNRHRILAASCPAGPAFEGGAIACGMPALDGAIEDVAIDDDGKFKLGVIGDAPPQASAAPAWSTWSASCLRTGRMNEMGRFEDQGIADHDRRRARHLLPRERRQRAGAGQGRERRGPAHGAAAATASHSTISTSSIWPAVSAGTWTSTPPRRIGLIPNLPDAKFVQVGNAAIEGASHRVALDDASGGSSKRWSKRVEHCRLETHPRFFDFFVEGCQFKPVESLHEVAG